MAAVAYMSINMEDCVFNPLYYILHSFIDPLGVHLQSFSSVLHSTPHGYGIHKDSYGVDYNRTLDLVKLKKSIGGVLVESLWILYGIHKDCTGMLNKMHL